MAVRLTIVAVCAVALIGHALADETGIDDASCEELCELEYHCPGETVDNESCEAAGCDSESCTDSLSWEEGCCNCEDQATCEAAGGEWESRCNCDDDSFAFTCWNVWVGAMCDSSGVALCVILGVFFCIWNSMLQAFMGGFCGALCCEGRCKPSLGLICPHWLVGFALPAYMGGVALASIVLIPYFLSCALHRKNKMDGPSCWSFRWGAAGGAGGGGGDPPPAVGSNRWNEMHAVESAQSSVVVSTQPPQSTTTAPPVAVVVAGSIVQDPDSGAAAAVVAGRVVGASPTTTSGSVVVGHVVVGGGPSVV
jgi:hypothetical protein